VVVVLGEMWLLPAKVGGVCFVEDAPRDVY